MIPFLKRWWLEIVTIAAFTVVVILALILVVGGWL